MSEDLREAQMQVGELSTLARRLAHSLKKANPDSGLPDLAMDYLCRHDLQGSPLRGERETQNNGPIASDSDWNVTATKE